jgi:hypothetical protein
MLGLADAEGEILVDVDGLLLADELADGLRLDEGERETLGESLELGLTDEDGLILVEADGLTEAEGLIEVLADGDTLALGLALELGETEWE